MADSPALLGWLALGSMLVSLGCVLYVALSGPIATARLLRDLSTAVQECQADLESVGLRWEKYRESVDGLVEELTQTEQRVERGRRKTQQAANRLNKPNGPAETGDVYADLRARARSQGHPV